MKRKRKPPRLRLSHSAPFVKSSGGRSSPVNTILKEEVKWAGPSPGIVASKSASEGCGREDGGRGGVGG